MESIPNVITKTELSRKIFSAASPRSAHVVVMDGTAFQTVFAGNMAPLPSHKGPAQTVHSIPQIAYHSAIKVSCCDALANKPLIEALGEFRDFTEVSRCDDNSWCCAGVAGQTVGGTDCCDQSPTSLKPFPFSVVQRATGQIPIPMATSIASSTSDPPTTTGSAIQSASSTQVPTGQSTSASSAQLPTRASTSSTSTSSSSASSGGLNTGSKIGIGVAVPVAAILLAVLVYLFLQNRKHKRNLKQARFNVNDTNSKDNVYGQPMLQDIDQGHVGEMDARENFELSNSDYHERHELGGMTRHELNASGRP